MHSRISPDHRNLWDTDFSSSFIGIQRRLEPGFPTPVRVGKGLESETDWRSCTHKGGEATN